MTDKVQKIREEVEKLKSNLIYGACSSQIAKETMCKEEAYNEVLAILDTMQEEPVSIWHDASEKSDNPEDVVIINPSDNTGEVLTKCTGVNQGRIWAYTSKLLKLDNPCNIGKNLQEPQVKESAEIQHVNDMCKENGNSLTQESVSEELEEAADNALSNVLNAHEIVNVRSCLEMFKSGAKWKVENLWKPADGDDLPEIDREVIALLDNGKVGFAHRPPEYWDGKDIITGKVTRHYPKTYDKGGWNTPNVKYWLDAKLPYEENKITK